MKRYLIALALLAGTWSVAQAQNIGGGTVFNGISPNGLTLNGLTLNGLTLNGWTLNGLTLKASPHPPGTTLTGQPCG